MKKKTKNKLNKGSLLLAVFLFIILSYFDLNADKENITLIASNENTLYTNVNAKELLDVLDNETGVVIIVNDKVLIKTYMNILTKINNEYKIYVYNCKNDEIVLTKENGEVKVVQDQSSDYKKLVDRLGYFSELYVIDEDFTNYYKISTPMVMFINNGDIKYSYSISNQSLTIEELSDIYKMGFEKIREN